MLHNDPDVCNSFSNKLDDLLSVDPPKNNDVNFLESVFTESIIQASESEIPKLEASAKKSPWINDEFLSLTKAHRAFKDPIELKELSISIKKLHKLKNDYFSNLARNINSVGEARKIEEEFRLCKSYTMHSYANLITSGKMTEFFQDHLKEKPVDLQPEVITPGLYPHVLPPDDTTSALTSQQYRK